MLSTPSDPPARILRLGPTSVLRRTSVMAASFFTVLLSLLVLIGFIIWQAENAQTRVRQSIEARTAAEALLSAIRDAELQQRNLLISDEPDYRARLELALARVPIHLARLFVESDEVTQEERLGELGEFVSRRIAEIRDVVEELERLGETVGYEAMKGNERRATMARIVDLLQEFDAEEDRIQTVRESTETQVRIWLVPALIAALAATCGLGWIWVRQERALSAVLSNVNQKLESQVRERTAELERERRRVEGLLADMTHRIGNSLSMVSSFLSLEARRSKEENVKAALYEANRRVAGIASAQRRLRISSDRDEVSLARYLCDLVQDLRLRPETITSGPRRHSANRRVLTEPSDSIVSVRALSATMVGHGVSLRIDAIPVTINSHDAVAVGIILNELVTNALKHAFPQDRQGLIRVSLTREGGRAVLSVADDGVGLGEAVVAGDQSLGFLVVKSMVASIRGDLRCRPSDESAALPGTEWRLTFDA